MARNIFQCVGLVENDGIGAWDERCIPHFSECEIRKKEMVIHNQEIGLNRPSSGFDHKTIIEEKTLRTRTALCC